MKRSLSLTLLAGSVTIATGQLLYQSGFESDLGWAPGPLGVQGTWLSSGPGANTSGWIVSGISASGSQCLLIDAQPVRSDGWWWVPISYNPLTSTNKLLRVEGQVMIDARNLGSLPQNRSHFGFDLITSIGTLVGSIWAEQGTGVWHAPTGTAGGYQSTSATSVDGQWASVGWSLDFDQGRYDFDFNGARTLGNSPFQIPSAPLAEFALFVGSAGGDRAFFDDLEVVALPIGTVRPRVRLRCWNGFSSEVPVTVEVRKASGELAMPIRNYELDARGRLVFTASARGLHDLSFKAPRFLRKTVRNVELTSRGVFTIDLELTPGDIDGDNAVTVFDYALLSDYFDWNASDPGWATPGPSGVPPKLCDLDGDLAVTVFDYGTLSVNFDQAGD